MEPQVIYRRWRPRTLSEVVGQEAVTTTLRNAVRTGRVGHAYLFSGPRGTGKTSTGRILAKAVNCLNPVDGEPCGTCDACVSIARGETLDILEIDAASNRGVEDIRMLRERVGYAASSLKRKVYIIDEVHMLTDVASNALLKTLEEPPAHVMFVLATTELHKVLPTIVSRCQCFAFRRLAFAAIISKLRRVCDSDAIEASDEALALIARAAGGSLRDAENLLQQLVASHGVRLSAADVREELGGVEDTSVLELVTCVVTRNLTGGLRLLHHTVDGGVDARHLGRRIVDALHDLVLIRSGCPELVEAAPEQLEAMQRLAADVSMEDLASAMRQFSAATSTDSSRQLLALELALVDWNVRAPLAAPASTGEHERSHTTRASSRTAARSPVARAPSRTRSGVTQSAEAALSQRRTATTPAAEAVLPGASLVGGAMKTAEVERATAEAVVPISTSVAASGEQSTVADSDRSAPAAAWPASAATADSAPLSELDRVRSRWKDYVDSLRGLGSAGNLDALLRSACEPVALDGDVLVLRFAYEFHRGKVEDQKYRHIVEEQLQRFYERPYRVSCVLAGQTELAAAPVQQTVVSLIDAVIAQGGRVIRRGSPPLREGGDGT